jgi:hypothetical protein
MVDRQQLMPQIRRDTDRRDCVVTTPGSDAGGEKASVGRCDDRVAEFDDGIAEFYDDGVTELYVSAAGSTARGPRSSRRKRGLFRRTGIVLPAFGLAVLLVGIVTVAAYVHSNRNNVSGLAEAINGIPQSGSAAALAQERQTLIVMSAASKTLSVAAKPATVNPSQVIASQQAQAAAANSGTGSSSGTVTTPQAAPPDPGTAQQIGYQMLPSFGFNQTTQWTCLLNLWNRESGWLWDAENPTSLAYGIPQALPGYKMASAGADWQTNPATQINWGLGYISQRYGTPCGAWDNELAYGYY